MEVDERKTAAGENDVIVGIALVIDTVMTADMPPIGVGLVTPIVALPATAVRVGSTVALSSVALRNFVFNADPFQVIAEEEIKPLPTTSRTGEDPAAIDVGEMDASTGTGLARTVRGTEAEVPPPGAGVKTAIWKTFPEACSAAVNEALSCVLLTNVVARDTPLTCTTEEEMKFVPVTLIGRSAELPASTAEGLTAMAPGTGFTTAKVTAGDEPPPGAGVCTVMLNECVAACSAAVREAPIWLLLRNFVVRALPSTSTTEEATKLVPVTTKGRSVVPPMSMIAGLTETAAGTGLITANAVAGEVPPPGAGVETAI